MAKKKLQKYAKALTLPNLITSEFDSDGKLINHEENWNNDQFKDKKIVLELGCGKGEYTLAFAEKHPGIVFIGIDLKSDRMVIGAQRAIDKKLTNVLFIRTPVYYLDHFFKENSIDEIWITFPDPYPNKKGERKRLTAEGYLNLYRRLLKPKGIVHLKTDNQLLYDFTSELVRKSGCIVICETSDLYNSSVIDEGALSIESAYEKKFLPIIKTVKYMEFSFK